MKIFSNKLSATSSYIKRSYDAAAGSGNLTKRITIMEKDILIVIPEIIILIWIIVWFLVQREKNDQIGYNKDLTGVKRCHITLYQVFMIIKKNFRKPICYFWFTI